MRSVWVGMLMALAVASSQSSSVVLSPAAVLRATFTPKSSISNIYPAIGMIAAAGLLCAAAYECRHIPHPFTRKWTVDDRHITQSWPPETVAWLREKAVSGELRQTLDDIFHDEKILRLLSQLYMWRAGCTLDYPKQSELEMVLSERARIMKELEREGFSFYQLSKNDWCKSPSYRHNISWEVARDSTALLSTNIVFFHKSACKYVFKMSTNEVGNVGRISYADFLRDLLEQHTNPRPNGLVMIPAKHVYIMPMPSQEAGISYIGIPKVIIVAEKCTQASMPLGEIDKHNLMLFIGHLGYADAHAGNVVDQFGGIAIIDTEMSKNISLKAKPPGFISYRQQKKDFVYAGLRNSFRYGIVSFSSWFSFHRITMSYEDNGLISYKLKPCIIM